MPELIDRQAALDIAMSYCPGMMTVISKAGHDLREMLDEIEELPIVHIDNMAFNIQNEIQAKKPSRTVEITFVRHGRWIELPKALNPEETPCKCSACWHILSFYGYYPKSNFCPNCGAQMDADHIADVSKKVGGDDNG